MLATQGQWLRPLRALPKKPMTAAEASGRPGTSHR